MPDGKDSPLPPEQIRQQVDQIMDRWQSYPNFAALLTALMEASEVSLAQLARQISQGTNHTISKPSILQYRRAETEPAYTFIENLVATNALHLDPKRIEPAAGDRPAGDQRVALFTAAGLIEVTPESILDWNQEVLTGYQRLIDSNTSPYRLRWGDLMTKLLSFHQQGGRQSQEDIADTCNANGSAIFSNFGRISEYLNNKRTPAPYQRLALYRYAGLNEGQIAVIEDDLATGILPLGYARRKTAFAAALTAVLDKLAVQNVSLTELERRSVGQHIPGASPVTHTNLSAWRHGRDQPTLGKLRALISALRQCGPGRLSNPVTPAEIDRLIAASGFRSDQLSDSTHDIIARIDEQTRIQPLLRDLQSALDTCLPAEEVYRRGAELGYAFPSVDMLRKWEVSSEVWPPAEQVQDLLLFHNEVIRQKGFPPLCEEEIAKVVAVAARDHARWQALSHAEKLAEQRPRPRRKPPSPSFDGAAKSR